MLIQLLFVIDITCKFFILCSAKLFVSYIIINRPVFLCCHGIVLWSHTSCLNAILYWLFFESNLFKTFFLFGILCANFEGWICLRLLAAIWLSSLISLLQIYVYFERSAIANCIWYVLSFLSDEYYVFFMF